MKLKIYAIIAAIGIASVAVAPSISAEAFPWNFSITYLTDASGATTFSTFGNLPNIMECPQGWVVENMVSPVNPAVHGKTAVRVSYSLGQVEYDSQLNNSRYTTRYTCALPELVPATVDDSNSSTSEEESDGGSILLNPWNTLKSFHGWGPYNNQFEAAIAHKPCLRSTITPSTLFHEEVPFTGVIHLYVWMYEGPFTRSNLYHHHTGAYIAGIGPWHGLGANLVPSVSSSGSVHPAQCGYPAPQEWDSYHVDVSAISLAPPTGTSADTVALGDWRAVLQGCSTNC